MSKSSIATAERSENARTIAPVHPGVLLREDFLEPLGLTAYGLAKACHVPRTRIERILREETAVSAETALRLGRYFGTSPQFWMNVQARYEVETAREQIGDELESIVPRQSLQAAE